MQKKSAKAESSVAGWIAAAVIVVVAAAAGIYLAQKAAQPDVAHVATPSSPSNLPTSAATAPAPAIQHPIADAEPAPAPASTAALPALNDSDAGVRDDLLGLAGGDALRALLLPQQIIPRIVATVDALPRQSIGNYILPLRTPAGAMQVQSGNGTTMIGAANADRYAPYMTLLEQVDPHALVAWYKRDYPLFQQAYRELGYPHGYFNDRLLVAIDDMLQAPEPQGPVAVNQSGTRYLLADAQWQSRSVGQKLLLRMGPSNEAQVKAKLRMIRSLLVGKQVAH